MIPSLRLRYAPILPACSSSPRLRPLQSVTLRMALKEQAIAAYEQHGEFSAAGEVRRLFPAVTDTAQARACARTIAGWKPLPVPLRSGKRRDPGRDR